ncbi:MAG: heme transporter HemC, partial [Rhodospirillales bacterium]
VDWWNTLHQPASVVKMDGPAIHISILIPLLLMAFGYMAFYLTLLVLRMRTEIAERKIRIMRLNQAADAGYAQGAAEQGQGI